MDPELEFAYIYNEQSFQMVIKPVDNSIMRDSILTM